MTQVTRDIGQRLWSLCNLLRDDGVTYHEYVTELTYLLFLKMANETGAEANLTSKYRWDRIEKIAREANLGSYKELLLKLGRTTNPLVRRIFADATTTIRKPRTLTGLVAAIDALNWYSIHHEQMGDLYEDLLERNASEKKSGAGQYFTPRPLVECVVNVMKPGLTDVVQDPAAGTGGFLVSAWQYLEKHNNLNALRAGQLQKVRRHFYGMELVPDTYRLGLMNLAIHGFDHAEGMHLGDTLTDEGARLLPPATLILTNPPFGTKKGLGAVSRNDFTFPTNNKQLAFLQHVYGNLEPGGRAALVVPDNVLFESNTAAEIRCDLMDRCRLHTILRLPTGIFYAQGVKTNVLFFTKGAGNETDGTREVWVYDLRTNMPVFGKRTPLTSRHFSAFEKAFGNDPYGDPRSLRKRKNDGDRGRFRKFSREDIAKRDNRLNISWLRDELTEEADTLPDPAALAREAMAELDAAMTELRDVMEQLGGEASS